MTHVVTENCIQCRYTDCVDVCPVDCFHAGPNFLVIDPDECIDCAVCVAECPADAIYAEEDLPEDQQHFIAINAELSPQWEVISRKQAPLPDADEWKGIIHELDDEHRALVHRPFFSIAIMAWICSPAACIAASSAA